METYYSDANLAKVIYGLRVYVEYSKVEKFVISEIKKNNYSFCKKSKRGVGDGGGKENLSRILLFFF